MVTRAANTTIDGDATATICNGNGTVFHYLAYDTSGILSICVDNASNVQVLDSGTA